MNYVTRDGVRLAFVEAGAGDRSMLLVHGMQCNHTHMMGLRRPVAMGHSFGGSNLLNLAVEYPHFLGGLVILDSGIRTLSSKVDELKVGHADTVGSDPYNMCLSRRRAESAAAQLEKDGISSSEIQIVYDGGPTS